MAMVTNNNNELNQNIVIFLQVILSFFSSLGGAAALLLLLVPVGRITVTYPEEVLFSMGCDAGASGLRLNLAEDLPCNRSVKTTELWTRFETCGLICQSLGQGSLSFLNKNMIMSYFR